MRLLVFSLIVLLTAARRQADPRDYIYNVLNNGEPFLLKVWIEQGS